MRNTIRALAPLLVAALLAGCGSAPDRAAVIASFRDANPDATEEQVACVVDDLIERYGIEELGGELEAEPLSPELEEAQFRAMFLCGIDSDVTEQITTQLADAGIAEEDAPCVADELIRSMTDDDVDVLLSGEITDSFAEKFYAAAETCEALPES